MIPVQLPSFVIRVEAVRLPLELLGTEIDKRRECGHDAVAGQHLGVCLQPDGLQVLEHRRQEVSWPHRHSIPVGVGYPPGRGRSLGEVGFPAPVCEHRCDVTTMLRSPGREPGTGHIEPEAVGRVAADQPFIELG